jgi:hypothetical protein
MSGLGVKQTVDSSKSYLLQVLMYYNPCADYFIFWHLIPKCILNMMNGKSNPRVRVNNYCYMIWYIKMI